MSMNTPIGNITQTTPIKNFKELDEMQNEQYLLGIDNNAVGNGSKISLENLINSSISADDNNLITKGTDDRLLVNTPVEIGDLSNLTTTNKSTLVAAINEVDGDITAEATIRQNADNNLQSQIDAITAASDVTDIVGTYAELQAYDTTGLSDNSIIKVLQDESRQNETTYYRWVITGGVGAWVLIGEEGPYYTISRADSKFATQVTVGDLNNLATSDKSSVVNAMNELASVLDPTQTADYIKNSKGLESGEVSSNSAIYPWVEELSHSTFDSSKFTVEGSPTITSDGIASGFSSSNRITKTISPITNNNNIIIKGRILNTAYSGGDRTLVNFDGWNANFGQANNNGIYFSWATKASSVIVPNSVNEYIDFEFEYTANTKLVFRAKKSSDETYISTQEYDVSGQTFSYSTFAIGTFLNGSNPLTTASIDLKQFSITVDGVEVFSGNKTGIDTIKPDDYTVVGTPTITPDGVASDFSGSNRIKHTFDYSGNTLEVSLGFYFVLDSDGGNLLQIRDSGNSNNVARFFMGTTGNLQLYAVSGETLYFNLIDFNASTGDFIVIKAKINSNKTVTGTVINVTKNITLTQTSTGTLTSDLSSTGNILYIGNANGNEYYSGSIDLNSVKIYVDGDLVYQPCLKIPYTESKTGSKIVDSIYRGRVNDMAEQFGYANYYTLDEDNGNFTLPQVELYGYIEKRARDIAHPVAQPFYRFSDEINEDEVRLEGAEVDKGLYLAIEQDPYLSALCTAGSTSDKICLPDFRNRVIYGDVASGYVEPELPNVTGSASIWLGVFNGSSGCFERSSAGEAVGGSGTYASNNKTIDFDASRSSSIYKNGGTVKTAGVKARWLCRWK